MSQSDGIDSFVARLQAALGALPRAELRRFVDWLHEAAREGASVYLMGNGGSASTCSHFAADLLSATEGTALRVNALVDSLPRLTALANDEGYAEVFAWPLRRQLQPGDVVIALSGSGRSENVLRGLAAARAAGARTVGLLGSGGGAALPLADLAIVSESTDIKLVETLHSAVAHMIATTLRQRLRGAQP